MTANIRTRANRRVPHKCDPYYDFKHPDNARPGDLWECPHGNIWINEIAVSLYVWSEIYRDLQPIKFWRARRAIDRARMEAE